MIIALALSDKFTDEFVGLPSGNPTSEQMMNEWADMAFGPKTFADIFPPFDLPKPNRVKGIGEDWFRNELQKGLTRGRLNYQGEIKLPMENTPNGNPQEESAGEETHACEKTSN